MEKFSYFLYINLIQCQSILIFRFRCFFKSKLFIGWLNSYKSFTNQGQIPVQEVEKEHAISIQRLLELGIIKAQINEFTSGIETMGKEEEIFSYNITPFGTEVFNEIYKRMNLPPILLEHHL